MMPNDARLSPVIPTITSLHRQQRRVDRRRAGAARVVAAMSRGQSLHKHFTRSGPVYTLTDDQQVAADVAALVIADVRVRPVNDGLFPTTPQTWRWCE
jgi:hypothetical protein